MHNKLSKIDDKIRNIANAICNNYISDTRVAWCVVGLIKATQNDTANYLGEFRKGDIYESIQSVCVQNYSIEDFESGFTTLQAKYMVQRKSSDTYFIQDRLLNFINSHDGEVSAKTKLQEISIREDVNNTDDLPHNKGIKPDWLINLKSSDTKEYTQPKMITDALEYIINTLGHIDDNNCIDMGEIYNFCVPPEKDVTTFRGMCLDKSLFNAFQLGILKPYKHCLYQVSDEFLNSIRGCKQFNTLI